MRRLLHRRPGRFVKNGVLTHSKQASGGAPFATRPETTHAILHKIGLLQACLLRRPRIRRPRRQQHITRHPEQGGPEHGSPENGGPEYGYLRYQNSAHTALT